VTTAIAKPGRNELCSCGSGRKFKRCCDAVDVASEDAASRFFGVAVVLAALMLVGGLAVFAKAFFFDEAGKRVWSPEHGHYHKVGGGGASEGGPGKVWNEAHGHYHDAAKAPPPPLEGQSPVQGALKGLRSAELDAVREKAAPSDGAQ